MTMKRSWYPAESWPRAPGALARREHRISRRAHRAARRGDRAAPPDRARRRAAPRAAAGPGSPGDYQLRRVEEGAMSRWPSCSATRIRWSSTPICSGRSASGPARCAPRCSRPGKARRSTSSSASRSRSPRARAREAQGVQAEERGWRHLPLYSDAATFSRDYHAIAPDGGDIPQMLVFTRRDGTIRFFWAGEMDDEHRRSRPGPARRARSDAALDDSRFHARRTRRRLVPVAHLPDQ
jgi:hypothetical protein